MTAMPPLRDILNDTPVNAIDVDYNFDTIQSHINAELINRDGSVAMTGPLSLPGPPTAPQHAATKAYVDQGVVPIGTIWEFAGAVLTPEMVGHWAFCDGSSKSTTDPAYAALFAVIGYRFGGAGANFNLPDRGARVAVGFKAGDAIAGTLGAKGGRRDAVLVGHDHMTEAHNHGATTSVADLDHYHTMNNHTHGMAHHHDSNVRRGYDINTSNFTGPSNAIAQAGASVPAGTALSFTLRETAVCQNTVPGGNNQNTSGVQGRADNNQTDVSNIGNTSWWSAVSGGAHAHSHTLTTDARSPKTTTVGETPTNLNYPLYEVVNYIIRIG